MSGAWRQIVLLPLVVLAAMAWATPTPVAAAAGWELTASPTTIAAAQAETVQLRLTDTDGSGDIACARVFIGAEFAVSNVGVLGTSAASPWVADVAGTGPASVHIRNADGNGKLKGGDWVDFSVTVSTTAPGDHAWTADALQNSDCSGDPFLEPIATVITVDSAAPTPAAEPIAPPAAAPSLAPVVPFRSLARAPDEGVVDPTPDATSRALPRLGEPVVGPVDVGGAADDTQAREAGEDASPTSTGIGALVALLAILAAVGAHWALVSRQARRHQQPEGQSPAEG